MVEMAVRVPIAGELDIISARQKGKDLARSAGFSLGDQTVIAAAISEVARNILLYANRGEMNFRVLSDGNRCGLVVVASDRGPGIADVELALREGHSTSGGLGLGLPGAKRLMDEFEIVSATGSGTTITMRKWRPNA